MAAQAANSNSLLKIQYVAPEIVDNGKYGFTCKKCPLEHPWGSDECPRTMNSKIFFPFLSFTYTLYAFRQAWQLHI